MMLLRASSRNHIYESGSSCSVAVPEMKQGYLPVHEVHQAWDLNTAQCCIQNNTSSVHLLSVSYWSVSGAAAVHGLLLWIAALLWPFVC